MTVADIRSAGAARLERAAPRFLVDLVGYALVSVLALACDCGLLFALVAQGVHYIVASAVSFAIGLVVSYALSTRFVFSDRRAIAREAEVIGFATVGIAGLVLTQGLLYTFVSVLGLAIVAAKIITVGIVFFFNFLGRRHFVFVGTRG